jgi:integrase
VKLTFTQEDKFKKGQENPNDPYSPEQLQTLLYSFIDNPATSATTRTHRLNHIKTIYYLLVAMYTGFRAQTLGQLRKDSFDFMSDVPTITVYNELIDTGNGLYNTNKTASNIKLPLVKHLEKLNLEKFVNLKLHGKTIFGATSTLDQRVDAQLVRIGMKKNKQRIHAIRGTVSNAYNIAPDISTQLKEQLVTHAIKSSAKNYDDLNIAMRDYPKELQGKMERALAYKKIDFTRLNEYLKDQLSMFA